MNEKHGWSLPVTPEQVERVRARMTSTAEQVVERHRGEGLPRTFWDLFPQEKRSLDALPATDELARCNDLWITMVLDAFRAAGAEIGPDLYRRMHLPESTMPPCTEPRT